MYRMQVVHSPATHQLLRDIGALLEASDGEVVRRALRYAEMSGLLPPDVTEAKLIRGQIVLMPETRARLANLVARESMEARPISRQEVIRRALIGYHRFLTDETNRLARS